MSGYLTRPDLLRRARREFDRHLQGCHCERSEAIHGSPRKNGLLRRSAPRKDGVDGPRRHQCARLV